MNDLCVTPRTEHESWHLRDTGALRAELSLPLGYTQYYDRGPLRWKDKETGDGRVPTSWNMNSSTPSGPPYQSWTSEKEFYFYERVVERVNQSAKRVVNRSKKRFPIHNRVTSHIFGQQRKEWSKRVCPKVILGSDVGPFKVLHKGFGRSWSLWL